jgi:hypothetical protein
MACIAACHYICGDFLKDYLDRECGHTLYNIWKKGFFLESKGENIILRSDDILVIKEKS